MFFDTHAHYDAPQFGEDAKEILKSLPEEGVSLVLNVGCDIPSSQQAIAFAEEFPHVYAAVGMHPGELNGNDLEESLSQLKKLAQGEKVVAIGEIGLDYYWEENLPPSEQLDFFHKQMELSEELLLPVIIHDREAHKDSLEAVKGHPKLTGVFHCYSGSVEMARDLLNLGYYLSFTGVISYKNARKTLEVVDFVPMDRILLETDAPYLSPVPNRGKRNDSRNLKYTAQVVAERKGISLEEVAELTTANGKALFSIS
ncbi:MAG: TatD family hydrolase [Eubacteriales bacterium]